MRKSLIFHPIMLLLFLVFCTFSCRPTIQEEPARDSSTASVPKYQVDPYWLKPLPKNWIIGQVSGVAVDSRDHVWVLHRPGSLMEDEAAAALEPPAAICCVPAPPVMEFDAEGNLIQAWGGAGSGFDWPEIEHGILVDSRDRVWLSGAGSNDHQVLKFDRKGTFLLQIGVAGKTAGSNDPRLLGRPADMAVDSEANEVYVADGYLNRRVIVFDAETGEYKRHWGAYGSQPTDEPLGQYDPEGPVSREFRSPVHAVLISKDGLVYVADRANNRVQVFEKDGDFVSEVIVAKDTRGNGSAWDIEFSTDQGQTYLYLADGTNQVVWILLRQELRVLSNFGRSGRYAGQFHWLHSLAVDSGGNLYTGEVETGKRVQKFVCN